MDSMRRAAARFPARGGSAPRGADEDLGAVAQRLGPAHDQHLARREAGADFDPAVGRSQAELEHPLGKHLSLVYRYDELERTGVPIPGANAALTPASKFVRYTAGFVLEPAQAVFVKAGWEFWDTTDFADFHSWHVGFGGAF